MFDLNLRFDRRHVATYVILGVTTAVWLAQLLRFGPGLALGENLLASGGLFGWQIIAHPTELWRLVTAIFLHLSWAHFLMNMITLLLVGRVIEAIFGSWRFAGIYLLAGIFANAATVFLMPRSLSAGASTSIFGIFGAIAMLGFFTGDPRLKEVGKGFLALIAINLAINLFMSGVNVVGHIAGVVAGGLLAAVFPPAAYRRWIPGYVRALSAATFFVLLIIFVLVPFLRYG